jgi:hypothetical protein
LRPGRRSGRQFRRGRFREESFYQAEHCKTRLGHCPIYRHSSRRA